MVLAAIFGARYYQFVGQMKARATMRPPPPTVATFTATEAEWQTTLHAVASLESRVGITVKTEVEGLIVRVAFTSGAAVKAGDLLVELDTAREEAQLKGLVASTKLAELSLARARELRERNTNSASDLDAAEASYAQALAAADQVRVAIAKKHIVAPFAGRVGITQVNPGQYLKSGDPLVELEAVDPIFADFGLPQQEIARIRTGMEVRVVVDAFSGRTFTGVIDATSPRISDDTRNVQVRAVLPNKDETLRPGMFAQIDVVLPGTAKVILVPSTAISYNPYGDYVFVLERKPPPDGGEPRLFVRQQFVQVGAKRGDQVAVKSGISVGEVIVTAGQLKLRNGVEAIVDNTIVPDNRAAPTPSNS